LSRASLSKQAMFFETSRQKHGWSSFGAEILTHNAKLLLHSSTLALALASHKALEDSASELEAVDSKVVRPDDVGHRATMSSTTGIPCIVLGVEFGITETRMLLGDRYGNPTS